MRPEALQRALIRAVAFGDTANEHRLRRHLRGLANADAADYLHATVLVCLAHRFGEPAPTSPRGADRVNRDHAIRNHAALDRTAFGHAVIHRGVLDQEALDRPAIDDDVLGRFMAELRATGPKRCNGSGSSVDPLAARPAADGLLDRGADIDVELLRQRARPAGASRDRENG